jgi:DnaK suppressor protein
MRIRARTGPMATDSLRYQLRKQLATLEQRLGRLEDHQRNRGREPSRDSEDHAVELQNEEVVEALVPKTRAEINALRRALARLDAGLDVECVRCGRPIDARRLMIVPHANICARCAEQAQRV